MQGQNIIKPSVKSKTAFAIIIDSESYNHVKAEVEAYRQVVEKDGLGSYIISGYWSSPDQIKKILVELYNDKKQPLEGVVFIGDIPIPMLRDAQHLTSAFKMNQNRNWQQSSVPSDRFYDNFGLKFDFIKQDSIKPLYYYYSLRSDSEQRLNPSIYSARIKPLEKGKTGKYDQLRNYLKKIVNVRTNEKNNIIDNLTIARGHGYNSESRVAWSGEQLALREQLPALFNNGSYVRFMDFDNYWPMKPYWLNEVQRPELDIMLFHHHGSNDYQYINGYKEASDVNTSIDNIKRYLRSKIAPAIKKGKEKEETFKYYTESLDIPREWCEEALDEKLLEQDSIYNLQLDITVADVLKITPNARFVMFDACYNGSFYEDEYIAGAYLFNDGKTIVTQGNTVNTIQDKWPDRYLGLLNYGLRVGQWGKYTQYLETHILGDPTYHFSSNGSLGFDINDVITRHRNDTKFWKKALASTSVDVQCIALRMLYANNNPEISSLLKRTFKESPSMIVRLEALVLLSQLDNNDFIDVLGWATTDSYELIRRYTMDYIPKNGSESLLPFVARAILNDNTSKRIVFKISSGFRMFNLEKLEAELLKQADFQPLYSKDILNQTLKSLKSSLSSRKKDYAVMVDKSAKEKERLQIIAVFRNNPVTDEIETLLSILQDPSDVPSLRWAVAEALGWYDYSYRKTYIVDQLNSISAEEKDPSVQSEITKTINRLIAK